MVVSGFYTKNKKKRPITSRIAFHSPRGTSTENRVRKRLVTIDRKRRAVLRTLENPMLWSNFQRIIGKLNPEFDFEIVDRTLEWDEALGAIRRMVKDLVTGEKKFDSMQDYRRWMSEQGVDNMKLQNMIMMDDKPPTAGEIEQLVYALEGRPIHALIVDRAMKAPTAKTWRQYAKHPERYDIPGHDVKGTKTNPADRI